MIDDRLQDGLFDLGLHLEVPPPRDLTSSVGRRIGHPPPAHRSIRRPFLLSFAAVIAALTVLLGLDSAARTAVASWLGLPGIHISVGNVPSHAGGNLHLGKRITLPKDRSMVPLNPLVPRSLGVPDAIYVQNDLPGATRVSLVYGPHPGLPRFHGHNVGLLVTEIRAEIYQNLLDKVVSAGSQVEPVTVHGRRGYWVYGRAHMVIYQTGRLSYPDNFRLSANALIWEQSNMTVRIESSLGKQASLRLARSFVPLQQ
jgi:hypothetical protein